MIPYVVPATLQTQIRLLPYWEQSDQSLQCLLFLQLTLVPSALHTVVKGSIPLWVLYVISVLLMYSHLISK